MSQKNVEVVLGIFESTNRRDFAAAIDPLADDVVFVFHGELQGVSGPGAVGKEAVGRWFGQWLSTFDPDYTFEIDEVEDCGDRVYVWSTHRARGRASGAPVTAQFGYVYELRGGKIVRGDLYSSRTEALEAVGLRE